MPDAIIQKRHLTTREGTQEMSQASLAFTPLTSEQAERYEDVKKVISRIADEPDGLSFILSAVLLTGDGVLIKLHMMLDLLLSNGWDSRDIAGVINERPLELHGLVQAT